ncbi:hypothetical protein [Formivibrio citricus]|uniref:hypothetical protein n=1 Tax=Formivibrio citricus TaxID=83765 RepID=UPI0015A6C10D|nr:hypothetical protein [Formivibrio citricus]
MEILLAGLKRVLPNGSRLFQKWPITKWVAGMCPLRTNTTETNYEESPMVGWVQSEA